MRYSEFNEGMGDIFNAIMSKAGIDVSDSNKDNSIDNTSTTDKEPSKTDTGSIQDPDFNKKLTKVANALGIAEADLRAIIRTESNFKPNAEDPNHVSVGLIGFTERTAKSLGTSKNEIRQIAREECRHQIIMNK